MAAVWGCVVVVLVPIVTCACACAVVMVVVVVGDGGYWEVEQRANHKLIPAQKFR